MRFPDLFALLTRFRALVVLPRGRHRLATILAFTAGAACLLALMHRFRLGTDVTDESFSVGMPYRFALGDKPFVDEISIQQTAGIIVFPFVWLFVKITGGSTYLVLFVRALHLFVFKGTAAFAVYAAARRLLKLRSSAIACAFVPFAFVPHSIPNVGYNVIGMAILTAATFFCAAGVAERAPNTRFLFWSGVCYGVVSFAYPPMALAPILAAPLVFLCAPSRRLVATGAFIAGGVALTVALSPALRYGGIPGVKRALAWGVHSNQVHTWKRAYAVVQAIWAVMPAFYPYALAAVIAAAIVRSRALVVIVTAGVAICVVFWTHDEPINAITGLRVVLYAGLFAPPMVLLAKPDLPLLRAAVLIVFPALAAGFGAGYTSTQGPDAACLGAHSCMVLFVVLAARALERAKADGSFVILPACGLMFVLVVRCYDYVYRDSPLPLLTETVAAGPFKGIRTNPDRAHAFAEFSEIVRDYDRPDGRILVLYESTGYYLFSKMKPGAHCVWEMPYGDTDGLLAYWQQHVTGHGIVVRAKGTGAGVLDPILTPPERLLRETPHFKVYRDR